VAALLRFLRFELRTVVGQENGQFFQENQVLVMGTDILWLC
jgi:hypothetical protein